MITDQRTAILLERKLHLCGSWSNFFIPCRCCLRDPLIVLSRLGIWFNKSEICPSQAGLRPRVPILSSRPLLLQSSDWDSRRQRCGLNRWLWMYKPPWASLSHCSGTLFHCFIMLWDICFHSLPMASVDCFLLKANALCSLYCSSSDFYQLAANQIF